MIPHRWQLRIRGWQRLRKTLPLHSTLSVWIPDYLFNNSKWWDNDTAWRTRFIYEPALTATDWLAQHWPWCNHRIMNDQCGLPEHRYCVHCMRPFPNAELAA